MGTAGVAAKQSPFANYYRWEEPYSDITVCLNIDTANSLQTKVLDGTDSFPDAAFEIGGILLGRTEREAARTVIVIEDFDLVPCEHRQGPSYSLSTKELQAALARRKSGASQRHTVVGYFRSHNRDDLFLSADDLSVIRTCFRDPGNAFLVIKVLPGKTCTAGFFFWNNGEIQSEFTDSEVPLIPLGPPVTADEPAGDPDGLEELLASRSLEHGQSQAIGWRRRWVIAGCAITVVAAAALIAVVGNREKGQPPPRLQSPNPIVSANRTGSLPEAPAESPAAIPEPPKITVPKTAAIQSGQQKPERVGIASPPALPVARGTSPGTADNEPVRPTPSPAGTTPTTVAPPAIAEAPLVAENASAPALDQPRPVSPAPQPPAVTAPPTPIGPDPRPVETGFVGPQIIHQVAPSIPLGIGPKIQTPVQIDVTVTIDESGKVIGARVNSSTGAAAGLLSLETLKAAHLFRFRPATENSRPVRSDMVLTFRFAPKDR